MFSKRSHDWRIRMRWCSTGARRNDGAGGSLQTLCQMTPYRFGGRLMRWRRLSSLVGLVMMSRRRCSITTVSDAAMLAKPPGNSSSGDWSLSMSIPTVGMRYPHAL